MINGDSACSQYIEYGKINRTDLKAMVLLTDGLFMPRAYIIQMSFWHWKTVIPNVRNTCDSKSRMTKQASISNWHNAVSSTLLFAQMDGLIYTYKWNSTKSKKEGFP